MFSELLGSKKRRLCSRHGNRQHSKNACFHKDDTRKRFYFHPIKCVCGGGEGRGGGVIESPREIIPKERFRFRNADSLSLLLNLCLPKRRVHHSSTKYCIAPTVNINLSWGRSIPITLQVYLRRERPGQALPLEYMLYITNNPLAA